MRRKYDLIEQEESRTEEIKLTNRTEKKENIMTIENGEDLNCDINQKILLRYI